MLPSRALLAALLIAAAPLTGLPTVALAQPVLEVRVDVVPPPLPVYLQPVIPADGYLWAPGYWDWDPAFGYYWVPGTWVLPPRPNLLWTPGYWGWDDGAYVFHRGYWDTEVGFYGGVDYGYGYTGTGFEGGYWQGPQFFYNRSVTNITNVTITNVYTKTVVVTAANPVSYNGGAGGLTARPSPRQLVIAQQPHVQPTAAQVEQVKQARATPVLRATANHGAPPIAATPRAAAFHSPAVTAARPSPSPTATGASPRLKPETPVVPATPAGGQARDEQPGQHRPSEAERIADPRLKVAPTTPGQPKPAQPGVPPQDAKTQGQAASQHQEELKRAQEDEAQKRAQQAAEAQQRANLQHQEDLQRAQAADQQKHAQEQAQAAEQRAAAERQKAAEREQAEAQERLKLQNAQAQQHQEELQRAQAQQHQEELQRAQAQQHQEELQRAQAEQQQQHAQQAEQQRQQAAQRAEMEQQQRRQAEQQRAAPRPEPHPEHPECGHPGEPPCR